MEFTKEEKQQYKRHLILEEIGLEGQLKLKKAKVLVIGAGGLGCPILQYLSAAGVGSIGIIDNDVVEQSNLQRQILYTHQDIGKNKAESAFKHLQLLNPYIKFDVYRTRLTKDNALDLFEKYDIIIDGTDNFPTKYLINDAAVLVNKPVVFGSIYKFEGQVSVFNYKNSATYRCLYPTPSKPNEVPNCSDIGVLGVLPGIIGALQANEVLKIICQIGDILSDKLLTYNLLTMQQTLFNFKKNDALQIKVLDNDYEFACGLSKDNLVITLSALEKQVGRYNLLDVREDSERQLYNIGGQHIPLGELANRINEIIKDKDIVVYCKSGVRSKRAIEILKEKGLENTLLQLEGLIF
jgi:molybdopterin/thiamine biosynthesis adenylyltransferase/rhodanese-related sulfurtransferase